MGHNAQHGTGAAKKNKHMGQALQSYRPKSWGMNLGGTLAKARNVESVTTLINGESRAYEGGVKLNVGSVNLTSALGGGYLYDDDGTLAHYFNQYGFSVGVKTGMPYSKYVGADIERSYSLSSYLGRPPEPSVLGKVLYGLGNAIYGNGLDLLPGSNNKK